MLRVIRERAIIMDPVPRVVIVAPEADSRPRARYLQQKSNGLFIPIVLLQIILSN